MSRLQRVQRPASSTTSTPARSSSRRATSLRSSIRPSATPATERREGGEHLVADLVAAGPDARARSPRSSLRSQRRRSPTMPAARPRQPQWSIARPLCAGERDRQAVGDEDERGQARCGRRRGRRRSRRVGSGLGPAGRAPAGPRGGRSRAPWTCRPITTSLGIDAERGAEAAPVGRRPRSVIVAGQDTEVEARVAALADATESGSRTTATAPGRSASSHRIPSPSRQRIDRDDPRSRSAGSPGDLERGRELSLAAGRDLAVELARAGRRRARRRPPGPRSTPASSRSPPSISSRTSRHSRR